jgi:hypothetical protein
MKGQMKMMKQNISPAIDLCRQRVCAVAYSSMIVKDVMLRLVFSAFLFVLVLGCSCLASETPAKIDIYSKLVELSPLPKIHYSWGLDLKLLEDPNSRQLYQLARITHSLCVAGEWVERQHVDTAVYICARVNKTNPAIPSSIGINFSPWHRRFGKNLPPTDRGPTYKAELDYFAERINLIKKWVNISNQKYGTDVRISALLLDSERFDVRPGDEKWNEAIREALDAIHLEGNKALPDARIEWYNRGMHFESNQWITSGYFTGKEIKSSYSCSLYRLPEQEYTSQLFSKTCDLAHANNIDDVTPWIAIAAGSQHGTMGKYVWNDNWDFDPNLSYRIGKELNSTRPPYDSVKVVVFFPAPFYEKSPDWPKHFIAYVRGATGVKGLSDLGYREGNGK